jgi:predicted MFS family arabinose efflux permease
VTNRLWSSSFLLLVMGNFLLSISFYFLITVLPVYLVEDIEFSKSDAGIILSAYIFTAVIIRPFAGPMIDAFGRKTIYISSLTLFAILFPLYGLSSSYSLLIILRIFHGVSWGILTTAGNTLAMDLLPEKNKGQGMGYYGLAFTMAMAAGPFIASYVLNIGDYQLLFMASGLLAFMGIGMILFVNFPKNDRKRPFSLEQFREFLAPKTYPFALLLMLIMFPYGALLNFASLFCIKYMDGQSFLFFLSLALGLTTSRIFAGQIFDQKGPFYLLIFSFSTITIGFPIFIFINNGYFLSFSSFLIGIGYGISFLTLQLLIAGVMPQDRRATANSIFLTSLDLGIAGGTVLMGLMSDYLGLKLSFLTFVLFPIFCLIFYFSRRKRFAF